MSHSRLLCLRVASTAFVWRLFGILEEAGMVDVHRVVNEWACHFTKSVGTGFANCFALRMFTTGMLVK